jgi:hypothetical protein
LARSAGKVAKGGDFKFGRFFRFTVGMGKALSLWGFWGGKCDWPEETVVCPLLFFRAKSKRREAKKHKKPEPSNALAQADAACGVSPGAMG